VGKGSFGKVYAVTLARGVAHAHVSVIEGGAGLTHSTSAGETDVWFAMKTMYKADMIKQRAVSGVLAEMSLLAQVSHPFIANLHYAFESEHQCHFVMDLFLGGDLQFYVRHSPDVRTVQVVRFWVAEVALALDYLHSRSVVHRDLKPANIVLDSLGHVGIIDFNVATVVPPGMKHSGRAGTLPYMAPEVVSKRGHTAACDWWSLGCTMFELLTSVGLFRAKQKEEVVRRILTMDIDRVLLKFFPADESLRQVIRGLLRRTVSARSMLPALKASPFFEGLDWDALERRVLPPPFVPDLRRANFESSHDLVEVLGGSEEVHPARPLTHEERLIFKHFDFNTDLRSPMRTTHSRVAPALARGMTVRPLLRVTMPTSADSSASAGTRSTGSDGAADRVVISAANAAKGNHSMASASELVHEQQLQQEAHLGGGGSNLGSFVGLPAAAVGSTSLGLLPPEHVQRLSSAYFAAFPQGLAGDNWAGVALDLNPSRRGSAVDDGAGGADPDMLGPLSPAAAPAGSPLGAFAASLPAMNAMAAPEWGAPAVELRRASAAALTPDAGREGGGGMYAAEVERQPQEAAVPQLPLSSAGFPSPTPPLP
jgi:serine/threonine kinase 32